MDPNKTNFNEALARRETATAHITLENPLAGGSIYLNLIQCGWTF